MKAQPGGGKFEPECLDLLHKETADLVAIIVCGGKIRGNGFSVAARGMGALEKLRDVLAHTLDSLRPMECECDNTHEQNDTCCRPCWDAGYRRVAGHFPPDEGGQPNQQQERTVQNEQQERDGGTDNKGGDG